MELKDTTSMYWPFPVRAGFFIVSNDLVYTKHPVAGMPHVFEHLLVRGVKKAYQKKFGQSLPKINGATLPGVFYASVMALPECGRLADHAVQAVDTSCYETSADDFDAEKAIIVSEILERQNTLSIKVQRRVLLDYFGCKPWEACVLGGAETISKTSWKDIKESYQECCESAEFHELAPMPAIESKIQPASSESGDIYYDLKSYKMGKKTLFFLIFKASKNTALNEIRFSLIEQCLRHSSGENLNHLVRDRFKYSYGFHGMRLRHKDQTSLCLMALSEESVPQDLFIRSEELVVRCSEYVKKNIPLLSAQLRLESSLYKNAYSISGVLPQSLAFSKPADVQRLLLNPLEFEDLEKLSHFSLKAMPKEYLHVG